MFLIFISLTFSLDIGIDFGSFYTKSAIFSKNLHPEIALNLQTKRLTPTFISFKDKLNSSLDFNTNINILGLDKFRILIGDEAIQNHIINSFPSSGHFPLFIDLNENKIKEFEFLFKVNSTISNISMIDLLSLYFLNYLNSIVYDTVINSITIAVPAYFTIPQRKIIENAFINIGYPQIKIIDDVQAIMNIYCIEKQNVFFDREKQVLFIDIGAFSIKAYVAKFNLARDMTSKALLPCITRLSYVIDTKHGGSFVTKDIADYFQRKIILNITSKNTSKFLNFNNKEKVSILNAAENAKKQLTLVQCVPIDIEIKNQHYLFNFTRDEVEEIAKPTMQAAANLISEAAAGLAIDYVEVIGGASRIPLQIDYLKETASFDLYLNRISKSLNADESIAIGAAYSTRSNLKSDKYPLPTKIIDKFPIYSITANGIEISKYNSTHLKSFDFGPVNKIDFKYKRQEFPINMKTENFSYKITNDQKKNVTAFFNLNPTSINYISLCTKQNNSSIQCSLATFSLKSTLPEHNENFRKIINETNYQKRIIIMKGELAQYVLKIQDALEHNKTIISIVDQKTKAKILKKVDKIKIWLENISQIHIYNESIMNEINRNDRIIKKLVIPIFDNIKLNRTLSISLKNLKEALDKASFIYHSEYLKNKDFLNASILNDFSRIFNMTEKKYKDFLDLIQKYDQIEILQILSNDEINRLEKNLRKQMSIINDIKPSNSYLLKKKLKNYMNKIKVNLVSIFSDFIKNSDRKKENNHNKEL